MIERILNLMKDRGITASKLTEMLGVNGTTISEWKKGKTKPSVEHIRRLAEIFCVSTDYIINGKETNISAVTEMGGSFLSSLLTLPKDARENMRDFFYMCAKELDKSLSEPMTTSNFENSSTDLDFPDFDAFDAELDKKHS